MYSDIATQKHPIDRMHGGVSREWLVEQLPKAKYPNMLLEVAMHPYYPCTLCSFARITEDVLVDVLLGDDSMLADELCGLLRGLGNYGRANADYVIDSQLSICKSEQHIARAKEIANRFSGGHPAFALIQQQLALPDVPMAAVNNAKRFLEKAREDAARDSLPAVRSSKLPSE